MSVNYSFYTTRQSGMNGIFFSEEQIKNLLLDLYRQKCSSKPLISLLEAMLEEVNGVKDPTCLGGEIGKHKGLKIPRQ